MIKQCYVSRAMRFFQDDFREKYGLFNYRSRNRPAIFFGCYNNKDLSAILKHRSLAVIVWGGSDSMKDQYVSQLNHPRIKHIAQSKWIEQDLIRHGITSLQVPVTPFRIGGLKPCVNGNHIYVYTSRLKPEAYGSKHYTKLFEVFGRERFIVANSKTFTKSALYGVYSNCFLGLRLLEHDGLGVTNCELGVMGRHVVTNNNLPNSINYKTFDDIADIIRDQEKLIGKTNHDLSLQVRKYLSISNDWLNPSYYE